MAHAVLTRRKALRATLSTIGVAGCRTISPARPVKPTRSGVDFEAIVIGSGFGGAVAALRLGEAGVRTLVLERGMRWPIRSSQDTFASSTSPDGRSAWLRTSWAGRPVDRYAGVRDIVEAKG